MQVLFFVWISVLENIEVLYGVRKVFRIQPRIIALLYECGDFIPVRVQIHILHRNILAFKTADPIDLFCIAFADTQISDRHRIFRFHLYPPLFYGEKPCSAINNKPDEMEMQVIDNINVK